jgi:hypothetical protein
MQVFPAQGSMTKLIKNGHSLGYILLTEFCTSIEYCLNKLLDAALNGKQEKCKRERKENDVYIKADRMQ